MNYNLKYAKGHSFYGPNSASVLREIADFLEKSDVEALGVNLSVDSDGNTIGSVLYEGTVEV